MMGALLSGDFAGALKIAFLAVCKAAGLPGEELLSMLSRAGSLLINIIKNPVPFIKNLIAAAKKGFTQFAKNFGKHLKAGLMGWLFGQVAATGIKLPSSFSVAGIFDVVRQVLGLTYEYVRERAVAKIGEENVERIEKVASYLKILFTGGPAKLWEKIKGDLSNLKQTLMDGVVDFIVQKIVQSAVTKIASMLIPGAGFVQAIISTYNTIQFFVSKIKEIMAVVNSVLDSISKIAKGDIASAANYIEGTLAKTIPLVIGFMAKLIGIGGIGEKIRKIIDKLRTPVNKAVDFVIDKAVALFKSAVAGVKKLGKKVLSKIKSALLPKKTFKVGDETHTLWFKKQGKKAIPTVSSRAQALADLLEVHRGKATTKKKKQSLAIVESQLPTLQKLSGEYVTLDDELAKSNEASSKADIAKKLKAKETELFQLEVSLVKHLGIIMPARGSKDEIYKAEGVIGLYGKQIGVVGDQLTPDHQPQSSLMEFVAKHYGTPEMKTAAKGHGKGFFTINLHFIRHIKTRTYGSKKYSEEAVHKAADKGTLKNYMISEMVEDQNTVQSKILGSNDKTVWNDFVDKSTNEMDTKGITEQKKQIAYGENGISNLNNNTIDSWLIPDIQGKRSLEDEGPPRKKKRKN